MSGNNILVKDCQDFVPLKDGTFYGDSKYCDRSLECRQMGMHSDWYSFYNNEIEEYDTDYFCTGKKPTLEQKGKDEEVS